MSIRLSNGSAAAPANGDVNRQENGVATMRGYLKEDLSARSAFKDEVDNALEEEENNKTKAVDTGNAQILRRSFSESGAPSLTKRLHFMLAVYLVGLQATQYNLSLTVFGYLLLYGGPLVYLILQIPTILAWLLTWILRLFVIFDEQLSIGTLHLSPSIRRGQLFLFIHVEDLKFGICDGFQLEFLRVDDFKVQIRLRWEAFANLLKITQTWHPLASAEENTKDCPTKAQAKRRKKKHYQLQHGDHFSFDRIVLVEDPETGDASKSQRKNRAGFSKSLARSRSRGGSQDSVGSDDTGLPIGSLDSALSQDRDSELAEESAKDQRVAELKPRLGVIQVDFLDIDGAVINFETNKRGEFLVNSFVKDLAVAKTKQAIGRRPMPNTVRIHILRARDLNNNGGGSNLNARVVVSARRHSRETHEVMQTRDPTFDSHLEMPVRDPSTVLHVQVLDTGFSGKTLIGQWIMTTYWLAVDPKHCRYVKGTLYVSKQAHAIRGWFPLLDAKFQHGDGSRGEILMEIEWLYTEENDIDNDPLPTSLEQLQENSAETSLRLGDIDRVLTMLETFPYKLDIVRCSLRRVHFYLGDLFAGRAGLADTGGRAKGIRVNYIEMDNSIFKTKSKEVRGVSLREFLFSYFFRGLAPKIISSGTILGSGLREILYSLIMGKRDSLSDTLHNIVHGVTEVGERFTNILETPSSRVMLMVKGARGYHSKIITKDDADVFRQVRLRGFLLKADKPPGKMLRKYHRVEMTLQGNTLFYWRTSVRDPKKREGEGRKMYLNTIIRAEVDCEGGTDLVIAQNDRKSRWFCQLDPPEGDENPKLSDWVRIIREQRVIMNHPKLRADAERQEKEIEEQQLAKYNPVY